MHKQYLSTGINATLMQKALLPYLSICLVLLSVSLCAQPTLNWGIAAQGFGAQYEDASSVTYDSQANIYVTGYFNSDTLVFGNDTLYRAGGTDVFIVKYDLLLVPQWAIRIGGTGDDYGIGITCDSSDHIVVVGNFSSASIIVGTDTLTNNTSGTPDIFIARYDVNGNAIWARREGTTDWDNVGAVDMNPLTGDIYVAGAFYNADMVIQNDTFVNNGMYDMILMKFDLAGNYSWARSAGGNYNDLGNGIAWDNGGNNVYISGGFASDSFALPVDTLINAFGSLPDIFVIKYDGTNGNCIWARREGSIDNDHSVSVDVGPNGEAFVAGHYHSISFMFGNDTLTNMGMGDVFLLAYDSNGNPLWSSTAGGMDHDFGYHVWVDNGGRLYLSGMFMSMSITFGQLTYMNASADEDMFMMMYDPFGNPQLGLSGGGTGRDYISSIISNIAGIYLVGSFTTPVMTLGSSTLTNTDQTGTTSDPFIGTSGLPLKIDSHTTAEELNVYPNPGTGIFTFNSSTSASMQVEIVNSLGQVVYFTSAKNTMQYTIDLRDEPNGIYFAKVIAGGHVSTYKLVKQ